MSTQEGRQDEIPHLRWTRYPRTYRREEMETIAGWFVAGESGSVVGLPGVGRSTLLAYLHHRRDALAAYLPPAFSPAVIPVDLNILPDYSVATLYRVILRAFYQTRGQFAESLQQTIARHYQQNKAMQDPFPPQSALLDLLTLFQARGTRVVWMLNRFGKFCAIATPEMIRTLRGLRDSFKDTLCYVVGLMHEIPYLPEKAVLDPLYEILDVNVCWVGPLREPDARAMLERELERADPQPAEEDVVILLDLTGSYPALIRVVCHWWLSEETKPARAEWVRACLRQDSIRRRLQHIWEYLTQEEQFFLFEWGKLRARSASRKEKQRFIAAQEESVSRLHKKGVLRRTDGEWGCFGALFAAYVAEVGEYGRGRIWLAENTGDVYQGRTVVANLSPREREILRVFLQHPRQRLTYTAIIEAAWPDDVLVEGVTTEALYQSIRGVRKAIEPNPSQPVYVINWRGQPEGGYQFFPEGRPQR